MTYIGADDRQTLGSLLIDSTPVNIKITPLYESWGASRLSLLKTPHGSLLGLIT